MESNATGKGFKMKGHTLPGINQRSEGNTDLPDGRSASSPFQHPRFSKAPGDKNDHGPELKHENTYEAHNEPRPPKVDEPVEDTEVITPPSDEETVVDDESTIPTTMKSPAKHTGEDVTHPGPGKEGDEGYHKAHGELKPAFTAEEIKEFGEKNPKRK